MKGTIFVELIEMVEDKHGLDMVDAVIERCGSSLATGGAYTSVGNYDHAELLALIGAISELAPEHADTLLDEFAVYIIRAFKRIHPEFFEGATDYLDFLESVETRIHQEVLKLYAEARTPSLKAVRLPDGRLRIAYRSHRPLAPFAISMVRASARTFDVAPNIEVESMADEGKAADIVVGVAS